MHEIEDNPATLPRSAERARILIEGSPADEGLLYGLRIGRDGTLTKVELADLTRMPTWGDAVVWLHFNLGNARAREFLSQATWISEDAQDIFRDQDARRRVETSKDSLLAVIADLAFEADADPAEVATLWCYVTDRILVTARVHALRTTDQLRTAIRSGLRAAHPLELLTWILGRRTETLRRLSQDMAEQVSEIEDEILGGAIKEQREQLGRIRRFCARMRRHFAPDRGAFLKLLQRQCSVLTPDNCTLIRAEVEELSFIIDEASELYERAKLLQEELASRVAEDTGRSLYVLAILSAVFLPMTLITGIFGMNVAGLPGLHSSGAFWWVMVLILFAGGVTLATIFSRTRPK